MAGLVKQPLLNGLKLLVLMYMLAVSCIRVQRAGSRFVT